MRIRYFYDTILLLHKRIIWYTAILGVKAEQKIIKFASYEREETHATNAPHNLPHPNRILDTYVNLGTR
jgi:hypothetical protein